jgi:SHAQKYF class myb-like DNA-binding protein
LEGGPNSSIKSLYRVNLTLILGLMIYGKNWKKVEEVVCTRTAAQVRSHAQKFFNRLDK